MTIKCKECDSAGCFIKQYCSPGWIKKIETKKYQVHRKAENYIFEEDDQVGGIYFIHHGNVKVTIKGVSNREHIVRLAVEGDLLGYRGDGRDRYPVSAITLSDTIVCFFDNDAFYDVCMNNPKFTLEMTTFYSRELRKAEFRIKQLTQMTTRERVANALLYLKDTIGINKKSKSLNIYLTRQEIADLVGSSIAELIRELGKFENEKLIVKQERNIGLINIPGLKNVAGDYNIKQYVGQR